MNASATGTTEPERRGEQRYPCVGIALVYSAIQDGNVAGLGHALRNAALTDMSLRGLSFDVGMPLAIGQTLILLVEQPDGAIQEKLVSEVHSCVRQGASTYRVGVRIEATASVSPYQPAESSFSPIGIGPAMPVGAELLCPACGRHSRFSLVGQQTVGEHGDVMPLYDCEACGSTRSITSVLAHARQQTSAAGRDQTGMNASP